MLIEWQYESIKDWDEMVEWCNEHIDGEFILGNYHLFLTDETTGMAFKLRWL